MENSIITYYEYFMMFVKSIGSLGAIIGIPFVIISNWRKLFRPYLHVIELRRLKAVEEVYNMLEDVCFIWTKIEDKDLNFKKIKPLKEDFGILLKKTSDLLYLYLPYNIKLNLNCFVGALLCLVFEIRKIEKDKNDTYIIEIKRLLNCLAKEQKTLQSEINNWFNKQTKCKEFKI